MAILEGTKCAAGPVNDSRVHRNQAVKKVRTLLVDDNAEFMESAANFLGVSRNIEIIGRARSGREAIRLAKELVPDLVLVDISMPELNGIEVTRVLKKQPEPPKVVVLTLHTSRAYRQAAHQVGADGFVCKTDLVEVLLPTVLSLFKLS